MRKFLLGIVALGFLALSGTAEAGWVLRQNDDGTAEWVRTDAPAESETHAVGSRVLNAYISDVSTEATFGVVSPLTYAKVTYIQHVVLGDVTAADATYTFFVGQASDGAVLRQITGGVNGEIVVDWSDGTTTSNIVDTLTPSANNEIEKDQTILIHTDGGSTNTVPGMFTITVEPR